MKRQRRISSVSSTWIYGRLLVASSLLLAGCGGRVLDPAADGEESVNEPDTKGPDGGAHAPREHVSSFDGSCVACNDIEECGFCSIQIYSDMYVCSPEQLAPRPACWSVGEVHRNAEGDPFTCYYCGG